MTAITKFDKTTCQRVCSSIPAELVKFAADNGLKITRGNAKFDDAEITLTLKVRVLDTGTLERREKGTFDRCCGAFGLEPRHLGTVVEVNREAHELVGIEPKRVKFPLKMKNLRTGKVHLYQDLIVDKIINAARAVKAS